MSDFTQNVPDLIAVEKQLKADMVVWEKKLAGAETSKDPIRLALDVSREIFNYVENGKGFGELNYVRQAIRKYAGKKAS